ncbi:cyclic AMP-dependent transcription factor ATF-3 isoform X1 [Hylobates moloch]|uniref:cyclic AMP-dependent transcription factor ATF-3 isoform X1 n=1 Tax=Hylobates moloch TaxID=81572 RepID=UPI00267737E8|nr:cyclic AMP-dependent transcription factor ATF-3 isoform X1 [Hylobates moloch]
MQRSPGHSRTQPGAHCTALFARRRPSAPFSPRAGRESSVLARPRPDPACPPDPGRPERSLEQNDASTPRPGLCLGKLRFAIQNKHLCHRMSSALESVTVSDRPLGVSITKAEVAPEEDERKKRRRERNKIAAAKCRNKKKEKTECLQKESEKLESVNAELKAQIEELKNEKQHLIYMLNLHRPTCIVRAQNGRTPEDERNLFIQQIKEGTLQS